MKCLNITTGVMVDAYHIENNGAAHNFRNTSCIGCIGVDLIPIDEIIKRFQSLTHTEAAALFDKEANIKNGYGKRFMSKDKFTELMTASTHLQDKKLHTLSFLVWKFNNESKTNETYQKEHTDNELYDIWMGNPVEEVEDKAINKTEKILVGIWNEVYARFNDIKNQNESSADIRFRIMTASLCNIYTDILDTINVAVTEIRLISTTPISNPKDGAKEK